MTIKGATMKDVVDLCSESDEESSGPFAEQGPQRSRIVIVIDDSSDEQATPPNQDVIEIDSSSDDETSYAQESVARMPSFAADYDSSDDEQPLWSSPPTAALRRKGLSQPTTSGSNDLGARKPAKQSPRKQPSILKDAKCQLLHMRTVDSRVEGGHTSSAAVHFGHIKRDLPSASIAVPKTYARTVSSGERRPVKVSFGSFRGGQSVNSPSKRMLDPLETARPLATKPPMKKLKRKPPPPLENELVPLGRTTGKMASRLQNSIRMFASARASSSEHVRPHDSPRKSALKRPIFSSRKMERIPQSNGLGLNGHNVVSAGQSTKTLPTVRETHRIDGTISPTTYDKQHTPGDKNHSQALSLSSRQLGAESGISRSSMTNGGSANPPDNVGLGLNDYNVAAQNRKTLPSAPETRRIDVALSDTTCDEQHIGDNKTHTDSSPALSLTSRQLGAEGESSCSSMTVLLQSKGFLSANPSGFGSNGLGLNDSDIEAQSRKTLPTAPKAPQIGDAASPTTRNEQQICDDETKIDSSQAPSLSSRQLGAESEVSSSRKTVLLERKDLLSADSSGGRSDIPPSNSSSERSNCHSLMTDPQADRRLPNSIVDTAASSRIISGELSKQDPCLAESDNSCYDFSSSKSSDFVDSSDANSDVVSDESVAEESQMPSADLHVQLTDLDTRQEKRTTKNKVDYKERSHFKLTEKPEEEYLPPARTKKDRAAAESNGEDEPIVARSSTRKKKQIQIFSPMLDTQQDEEESLFGVRIEHLSKYTYDSFGRPTYRFSVLGADDTIYDLKIVVKESAIPDSGLGAHLTFLGARVLSEAVKDIEQLSRETIVVNEQRLMMPLEATSPDGFGIFVTLTGAHVKGKTCDSVLGDHAHVDGKCPKLIGGLGLYNDSDFVLAPTEKLFSKTCVIDIGRYGPVKKTDRLPQRFADVKSFIFSDEVETYGYDVEEPIHGTHQFVDITDNATGLPHKESRRLIPSYINEVGHHPTLKRNVHIRLKEDRSVHYYLDLQNALSYGDTVELLVDYDQSYEDVRERKGYGIANIENGEKSNEHEPTALWRYFDRREFIIEKIDTFSPLDVYYTLEFIVENVQEPVDAIVGDYINKGRGFTRGTPTDLQLRARRRMHWLSDVFLARISTLLGHHPEPLSQSHVPYNSLLNHSKRWAENLKWHSFAEDTKSLENRDNAAYQTLIKASREDILYTLSGKIVMPLNEAMWCPVAVQLIKSLSRHTALVSSLDGHDALNLLMQKYLKCAKDAALRIRQACKDLEVSGRAPDLLKFVTDMKKDEGIDMKGLRSFEGFQESGFFCKHTTFRKGIIASLLEIQDYCDAMAVSCLPEQFDMAIVPGCEHSSHEVLIAKEFNSENGGLGDANESLVGYPRHTDFFVKGGRINKSWYLLWQVVFVVHCFAEEFVGCDGGQYSLQALCEVVGVDFASARVVVEQGIETKEYSINFMPKKGKGRPKKKSDTKTRSETQTFKTMREPQMREPNINRRLFDDVIWKTLEEKLGWTLDKGHRPTDYYYLPPGVKRGCGFAPRKDFFDSVLQVMKFIKTDSRWKDEPQVVEALDLFHKLTELRKKLKLKRDFDLNWLIGQL